VTQFIAKIRLFAGSDGPIIPSLGRWLIALKPEPLRSVIFLAWGV
jgi:hypothetical protein